MRVYKILFENLFLYKNILLYKKNFVYSYYYKIVKEFGFVRVIFFLEHINDHFSMNNIII